jgi:hypothetical protein
VVVVAACAGFPEQHIAAQLVLQLLLPVGRECAKQPACRRQQDAILLNCTAFPHQFSSLQLWWQEHVVPILARLCPVFEGLPIMLRPSTATAAQRINVTDELGEYPQSLRGFRGEGKKYM